jgi:hypothetical protein
MKKKSIKMSYDNWWELKKLANSQNLSEDEVLRLIIQFYQKNSPNRLISPKKAIPKPTQRAKREENKDGITKRRSTGI